MVVLRRVLGKLDDRRRPVEDLAAPVQHEVVVRRHERKRDRQRILEPGSDEAACHSYQVRPISNWEPLKGSLSPMRSASEATAVGDTPVPDRPGVRWRRGTRVRRVPQSEVADSHPRPSLSSGDRGPGTAPVQLERIGLIVPGNGRRDPMSARSAGELAWRRCPRWPQQGQPPRRPTGTMGGLSRDSRSRLTTETQSSS